MGRKKEEYKKTWQMREMAENSKDKFCLPPILLSNVAELPRNL